MLPGCAVAHRSRDAGQIRRLRTVALVCNGTARAEAAALGGVTLQIVRDWMLRLNERGPDGSVGGKALGRRSLLEHALQPCR